MWLLIFEMVTFLKSGFPKHPSIEFSLPNIIQIIKKELILLGFYSPQFIVLSDTSDNCSRELLLTFGWILAQDFFILNLAEQCSNLTVLFDDFISQNTPSPPRRESISSSILRSRTNIFAKCAPDDVEKQLQCAVVLNQRITTLLKSIMNGAKDYVTLLDESQCCSSPDTSRNHTALLIKVFVFFSLRQYLFLHLHCSFQNDSLSSQAVAFLEKGKRILSLIHSWRKLEQLFWQWLEVSNSFNLVPFEI